MSTPKKESFLKSLTKSNVGLRGLIYIGFIIIAFSTVMVIEATRGNWEMPAILGIFIGLPVGLYFLVRTLWRRYRRKHPYQH